ncbi:MAG: Uma2 family endonuclease [Planctomycetota bacterium]
MATVDPQVKNWTRDEYYRMGDAGLFIDQRVELIDGEILMMSPMKASHATAIGLATAALSEIFGTGYWVRVQLPLAPGNESEPEPDIAVVPGSPRDYPEHPTTALLVIEISDTTLSFDRGRKSALYAESGIPEYWIVNLVDGQVEVHRDPSAGKYHTIKVLDSDDTLSPLAAQAASIRVADMLP